MNVPQTLLDGAGKLITRIQRAFSEGFPVRDVYAVPEGARTIDLRSLWQVAPGETVTAIYFRVPPGVKCKILSYAVFNDGELASQSSFFPTVDGIRVYPYQGDPTSNPLRPGEPPFDINLGVSTDLSDVALIPGLLELESNQLLIWTATNNAAVAGTMGVRVTGYLDTSGVTKIKRFGG